MLLQVSSVDSSAWGGACRGGRGQGAVSLGLGQGWAAGWVQGWGQGAPSRSDRSGGAESECPSF